MEQNDTNYDNDDQKIRMTADEVRCLAGALGYLCQNRKERGGTNYLPCLHSGTGADGLPICKAGDEFICKNKRRIAIVRQKLNKEYRRVGGAYVGKRIDGSDSAGAPVDEPSPKQVKFAKLIAYSLKESLPTEKTKKAYREFINRNMTAFQIYQENKKKGAQSASGASSSQYDPF